jgi:competence protein ComEA
MKLKEKIVGAVSILVLSLVFLISGYFINKRDNQVYEQIFSKDKEESIFVDTNKYRDEEVINYKINSEDNKVLNEEKKIVVDIKGSVKNPKEYELVEGSRVRDLIQAAGGVTEEADENTIHFSKILIDEECVYIYKKGEHENIESITPVGNSVETNNANKKININKASIEELSTLYGIGEVKAKAIIDYREKNGGFKSIEELGNVDGIGSKTVDKLRDKVDIK